jgi:hypothetical protein
MAKSIQFHPTFQRGFDARDERFAAGFGVGNTPAMMGNQDA